MRRTIRIYPDPVLRSPCDPIKVMDERVRGLVQDLLDTVHSDDRAGVAANQIGVGLQAFSWHIDGEVGYVLNPELVETSTQTQHGDEGCLSVPGLYFPTTRAAYAKVVGVDLEGNEVILEGEGLMARALQHEVDHLRGMIFLQRLDPEVRKEAMRQVRSRIS
ncbi:peptide deformylase [Pseudactinotalea sp. Z1739]|uniref:peptide deformylase n=1 Tax=Pseudactinotalea sp. Z1739 TaxID=3413028 RepID=UPI003C7DDAC5